MEQSAELSHVRSSAGLRTSETGWNTQEKLIIPMVHPTSGTFSAVFPRSEWLAQPVKAGNAIGVSRSDFPIAANWRSRASSSGMFDCRDPAHRWRSHGIARFGNRRSRDDAWTTLVRNKCANHGLWHDSWLS